MDRELTVSDPSSLTRLVDVLHDCFFSVDSIRYDKERKIVFIQVDVPDDDARELIWHLGPLARYRVPTRRATLTIGGVKSFSVEEPERTSALDINLIEYDPGKGQLRIVPEMPGSFSADVDALDLSLDVSDTVVRWSSRFGRYRRGASEN